jgi:hypothetical protein
VLCPAIRDCLDDAVESAREYRWNRWAYGNYWAKPVLALTSSLPSVTLDGTLIHLGANVESVAGISAAILAGAESIGLFRTELVKAVVRGTSLAEAEALTAEVLVRESEVEIGDLVRVRLGDRFAAELADLLAGRSPLISLMTLVSMCQISFGCEARIPTVGLGGWRRWRGRRQPCSRTSFAQVVAEATTFADSLSIASKGTEQHVPVLGRQHHLFDGGHIAAGELARACTGTRRTVGKVTRIFRSPPGMETARLEVDDAQDDGQGKQRSCAGDCAKNPASNAGS